MFQENMRELLILLQDKEKDIKNYNGIEYVAYDKEYTDEALDNDEYEKKRIL